MNLEAWANVSDYVIAVLWGEGAVDNSDDHYMLSLGENLNALDFPPGQRRQAFEAYERARLSGRALHVSTVSNGDSALMKYLAQLQVTYGSGRTSSLTGQVFRSNLQSVKEHAQRAQQIEALHEATRMMQTGAPIAQIQALLQNRLMSEDSAPLTGERASDLAEYIRLQLDTELPPPLRTGIATLDSWISGLQTGQLMTIAAAAKNRKTSLMLSILLNMARAGHSVTILMYESRREMIASQLVSMLAIEYLLKHGLYDKQSGSNPEIKLRQISPAILLRTGKRYKGMRDERVDAIDYGVKMLAELRDCLRIYDQRPGGGNLRTNSIESLQVRDLRRYGVGAGHIVAIDHLQRMPGKGTDYERQQTWVPRIEGLARTTDTLVFLLAQLKADTEDVRGGTIVKEASDYLLNTSYSSMDGFGRDTSGTMTLKFKENRYGASGQEADIRIDAYSGLVMDWVRTTPSDIRPKS